MADDTIPESAQRWRDDLDSWAIPPEILAAAPESPWFCPPALFTKAAEESLTVPPTPSRRRALEALPAAMGREKTSVLDVGAGAGAASLPLCPPAAAVTAVDQSTQMLAAFADLATRQGIDHTEVEGLWPDVAGRVDPADVVVCHHVLYNVGDIVPFLLALTDHARSRVVVEITAEHPQALLNPMWAHFHGLGRPTGPTAEHAATVARDLGLSVGVESWEAPPRWHNHQREEVVAFFRRRLCLPPDRDPEVAAVLPPFRPGRHVTLWWAGGAPAG